MQMVKAKGADIPALGLGTWPMRGKSCARAVSDALALGYRHIDTAQMYGNEADVGAGIVASGIPRGEIFITTKVEREWTSAKQMPKSVEDSLGKLGVDCVDLLLAHWPNPRIPVAETVTALCEIKRRGLARHIGVSNYTIKLLDEAVRTAPGAIVVNQIEFHPFVDQSRIVAANRRNGIVTTAYSPIARGRVTGNALIEEIAAAHGKSAIQVALRWLVQQGDVIAIPKSSKVERMKENLDIFDFTLTDEEMTRIYGLGGSRHMLNDPSSVPRWD